MDLTSINSITPDPRVVNPGGSDLEARIRANQQTAPQPGGPTDFEARIRAAQEAGPQTQKEKDLMKASQDFESFFLYMLLKEMRKTVQETPLFHGGRGEEIFRDMMDEEMAKKMADTPGPGLGIAKMLYEQLSRPIVMERLQAENTEQSNTENAEK